MREESASKTSKASPEPSADARKMQLRYGFNEVYGWWHFSQGEHRERIRRRHRLMGTQVVRLFVFDQPVPDPFKDWHLFAGTVQAVLDAGAKPMVTFAKFPPPYDDPRNIRHFVARCSEMVWGCIEQWGGETVKDWYWCIWNEPNNLLVGGDLTFAQYRRIYEEVAADILQQLEPHLGGRKAMIGGPAIDGTHRSYWMDWIARLVTEVDNRMIGFVSWHRYGDWRPAVPSASLELEMWDSPDAPSGAVFESLLMAQTSDYEARAQGVAGLLKGRDILNVCGELNTISHHENYYTLGLNQNMFGAAYYASALINLLRGGANLEMRWTATSHDDHSDAYGLMTMNGDPTPACLAKQLFAQNVRYGDWIRFPRKRIDVPDVDAVIAWDGSARRSGVFVNTGTKSRQVTVSDWDEGLSVCEDVLRIDASTGDRVVREPFRGIIRLDGYGMAVVTNTANDTEIG
jgi:glycosyl hydrolase family 39 (putative alpha-L-iduronidase)